MDELLTECDSISREQFELHLQAAMEQQLLEIDREHSRLLGEYKEARHERELARRREIREREQREENERYRRKAERKRHADLK